MDLSHTHALTQSWGRTKIELGAMVSGKFGVMRRSPARRTSQGRYTYCWWSDGPGRNGTHRNHWTTTREIPSVSF